MCQISPKHQHAEVLNVYPTDLHQSRNGVMRKHDPGIRPEFRGKLKYFMS